MADFRVGRLEQTSSAVAEAEKTYHVDGSVAASGVGTVDSPLKTIQEAVDALAAAGGTGTIRVLPGAYAETVTLENTSLVSVKIELVGAPGSVTVDAISSTQDNENLVDLELSGLWVSGDITLECDVDGAGSLFCSSSLAIDTCVCNGLTLKCIASDPAGRNQLVIRRSKVMTLTVENCGLVAFRNGAIDSNISATATSGAPIAQFGVGTAVLLEGVIVDGNLTLTGGAVPPDELCIVRFGFGCSVGIKANPKTLTASGLSGALFLNGCDCYFNNSSNLGFGAVVQLFRGSSVHGLHEATVVGAAFTDVPNFVSVMKDVGDTGSTLEVQDVLYPVVVDTSGGAVTLALPVVDAFTDGLEVEVGVSHPGGANALTLNGTGATVAGAAGATINANTGAKFKYVHSLTDWVRIS